MKPLVVRQPMPELTPPKLHLKDNASDDDYGDYDDNSRDGVHDHTQNCEMSDFHIWILKKMLRNKLDPFLRKRSLQGAENKTQKKTLDRNTAAPPTVTVANSRIFKLFG